MHSPDLNTAIKLWPKDALGKGVVGSLFLTFFGVVFAFLLQLLLTRLMSVPQYGAYIYVMTWLGVAILIIPLGYDSSLLRFASRYRSNNQYGLLKGLIRNAYWHSFIASMLLAGVVALFLTLGWQEADPDFEYTVWYALPLLPLLAFNAIRQSLLRAYRRVVLSRLPDVVIRPFVTMLLIAGVYFIGFEVSSYMAMACTGGAIFVSFAFGALYIRMSSPQELLFVQPQWKTREWLEVSLPLLLVGGVQVTLNYIDTIMIGILGNLEQVGIYSIAARVSMLVLLGMQAVNMVAAPLIAEYHDKKSTHEFQEFVSSCSRWNFVLSIPLLVLVIGWGDWVLSVFGEQYQSGYMALMLLGVGQFVNVSMGPVGFMLTMTGHQTDGLKILTLSLMVNVLLNFPAIYYYGLNGAAGATATAL